MTNEQLLREAGLAKNDARHVATYPITSDVAKAHIYFLAREVVRLNGWVNRLQSEHEKTLEVWQQEKAIHGECIDPGEAGDLQHLNELQASRIRQLEFELAALKREGEVSELLPPYKELDRARGDLVSAIDTLQQNHNRLNSLIVEAIRKSAQYDRLVKAIRGAKRYTPEIFGEGVAGEPDKDEDWFPVMLPDETGDYIELAPLLKEIGDGTY